MQNAGLCGATCQMNRAVSCIYAIKHIPSGRLYIGSAVNVVKRWREHKTALRAGKHHNNKLQRIWNKHGEDSLAFEIVEEVACAQELVPREQFYIDSFESVKRGLNICPVAGSTLGRVMSEEQRRMLSVFHTGRKHSAETRAKMSASSAAARRKGVKLSKELVEKIRLSSLGRVHSEETKRKMSLTRKGRPLSAETAAKIAARNRERALLPVSPETRQRMSESAKKRMAASVRNVLGRFAPNDPR